MSNDDPTGGIPASSDWEKIIKAAASNILGLAALAMLLFGVVAISLFASVAQPAYKLVGFGIFAAGLFGIIWVVKSSMDKAKEPPSTSGFAPKSNQISTSGVAWRVLLVLIPSLLMFVFGDKIKASLLGSISSGNSSGLPVVPKKETISLNPISDSSGACKEPKVGADWWPCEPPNMHNGGSLNCVLKTNGTDGLTTRLKLMVDSGYEADSPVCWVQVLEPGKPDHTIGYIRVPSIPSHGHKDVFVDAPMKISSTDGQVPTNEILYRMP